MGRPYYFALRHATLARQVGDPHHSDRPPRLRRRRSEWRDHGRRRRPLRLVIELRFRGNPVGLWGLLDELKAERLDLRFTPPPEQPDGMNWRVDVMLVVVEDPAAGATATSDAD